MKACGGCALCCKVLSVPELDKPACVWCGKLKRTSPQTAQCGIYAERPEACRLFQCVWTTDLTMQAELRPDRCHVVFSADDYVDGPYIIDEPWLHAYVDPLYPNAWRYGLPALVINTFKAPRTIMRNGKPFEFPGGSVAVHVGSWWQTFHKGEIKSGFGEVDYGFAVGMFQRGDLPLGMNAPILDFEELMRRG